MNNASVSRRSFLTSAAVATAGVAGLAAAGTDPRHGVLVEAALPKLLEPLGPSRAEPF